jgi:hypothetical protein
MAIMKSKNHKWLLWANLITVLPALVFAVLAALVLKDAAGYIGIVLIPLFIAADVVLIVDAVIGIKILYRKLAGKA